MQTEFKFIESIRHRAAARRPTHDVIAGIGDDAAVLRSSQDLDSLISTDLLIEDIDFRSEYITPTFLGHKVLAVSLSDIAAMGGKPRFSLISLGIPSEYGQDFWREFFDGYFALADRHGVSLVGGDTSLSPDKLVLDSIVMGECDKGCAVTRTGARVGDDIWVTGSVGAAAAGLRLLQAGERIRRGVEDLVQLAIKRHLRPDPPIEFGRLLGDSGLVHSMIDVSDGLAQDLSHICDSSAVSAELAEERVPVAPELATITTDRNNAFSIAISGGEDFELLFTADPDQRTQIRNLARIAGTHVSVIGTVIEREEQALFLLEGGKRSLLTAHGYEHFKQ